MAKDVSQMSATEAHWDMAENYLILDDKYSSDIDRQKATKRLAQHNNYISNKSKNRKV